MSHPIHFKHRNIAPVRSLGVLLFFLLFSSSTCDNPDSLRREADIADLKTKFDDLKNDKADKEATNDLFQAMQKKIDALETSKANLDAWKDDITALQTSLDTLKVEQSLKIQELEKQVQELKKNATATNSSLTTLGSKIQNLDAKLSRELSTITATMENLGNSFSTLKAKVDSLPPGLTPDFVTTLNGNMLAAQDDNENLKDMEIRIKADIKDLRNKIEQIEQIKRK